ncbi:MAG: Phenylalanine--tRNA ligase [Parcubacteria group bacterium]|nr:Phenylalanine--tRNA ligase [Parcubacteria group bacterium]
MKTSRAWLQTYFEKPLPTAEELGDALTFHSFEIEEAEGDLLEVKVLPDRAADCLSHRGVAHEIAAVLDMPMKSDSLRESLPEFPHTDSLTVSIQNPEKCPRYMGALIRGVKVGPSPEWLKASIEAVGQRSINNVVDATNYVMLNIGQPLHAFDAAKLGNKDGVYAIAVRDSRAGEKITTLTGEEYALPEGTMLITDASSDSPAGIAGVKGGKAAEVNASTTDIIIESANFDGTSVRRTAGALKLWTDASQRYQNKISPALAAYGMRDVLALIQQVAGGEVAGVVDINHYTQEHADVSVSLAKINSLLGASFTTVDVASAFDRLGFSYTQEGDGKEVFTVTPPFERRDITLPENLVEEAGRILGYDRIAAQPLPNEAVEADQIRYRGVEHIKDFMAEHGYTEISTQTFAVEGDITLANPLDKTKPALRTTLTENMKVSLAHAATVAPRVLGPETFVKLFEIGTVFTKDGEHLSLCFGYQQMSGKKYAMLLAEMAAALADEFGMHTSIVAENIAEVDLNNVSFTPFGTDYTPKKIALGAYRTYSVYPSAIRDIAVWTPEGTQESEVSIFIEQQAGELLARIDRFDRFEKDGRTSFAFRLVFQSFERTLADTDLDPTMEKVTSALNAKDGYEVR